MKNPIFEMVRKSNFALERGDIVNFDLLYDCLTDNVRLERAVVYDSENDSTDITIVLGNGQFQIVPMSAIYLIPEA